jgi:hypothetical protein
MHARVALLALACVACQPNVRLGTPCLRSSECPAPLVCGQGRCRIACRENRDCAPGERCFLDPDGTGSCSIESENGCASMPAADVCTCDLSCHEDVCVAPCTTQVDCPIDGVCRATLGGVATFCFATAGPDAGIVRDDAWIGDAGAANDAASANDASTHPDVGSDGGTVCTTGVCADAPPAGWSGPVQVYEAPRVPACPASTTMVIDGSGGLVAPDATCSTCTCGVLSGAACGNPTGTLFNDTMCGGPPCASRSIAATCGTLKLSSECGAASLVYMSFASALSSGSCTPSMQSPTVVAPTWSTSIRACAPTGASTACGAGGTCQLAPMGASICVYRSGDVPCPGGAYGTRSVSYTGVAESRDCSACTCDTSSVTCSGGTVIVSEFSICNGGTPSPVPSVCTVDPFAAGNAFVAQTTAAATPSGMCTAVQSMPTGAATPTGATTICCL